MIINSENLFLIVLGFIWIIGAVLQDLKRREVDNIWNFSLIAIALGYRALVSVYSWDYWFFINGILGFGIFLILGNIFYYSRLFAGGDAKLLIALGSILPLSYDWMVNLKIFIFFIIISFLIGSVYAFVWSIALIFKNFKNFRKEFFEQLKRYRKLFFLSLVFSGLWAGFVFFFMEYLLFLMAIVILLFPILFVFAKAIEESSMIKPVNPMEITEGDWLYRDINVNGKRIKANWEGVSKKEVKLIKDYYRKKILVKQGIPFTPGFLFGLTGLLILFLKFGWMF